MQNTPLMRTALALVFGGALGNLWDRLFRGTVTDFLQFIFGSYEFPSFNVADSMITIGAGLLLIDLWLTRNHQPATQSGGRSCWAERARHLLRQTLQIREILQPSAGRLVLPQTSKTDHWNRYFLDLERLSFGVAGFELNSRNGSEDLDPNGRAPPCERQCPGREKDPGSALLWRIQTREGPVQFLRHFPG